MRQSRKTSHRLFTAVRPGALGDTLLLAPLFRGLAGAECAEFIGSAPQAGFLYEWGLCRSIRDYELTDLHNPPRPADVSEAILFLKPDPHLRTRFSSSGFERVCFIDPSPPRGFDGHIIEFLAERLREHGVETNPDKAPFPPPSTKASPRSAHPPTIVLCPGSGSPAKNWPIENFRTLASALRREGFRIHWLLGPAEADRGIIPPAEQEDIVTHIPPILHLPRIFIHAAAVAGNDSGPLHLSALLGVPTVAVFQATEPHVWGPWGIRVRCAGEKDRPPSPGEVLHRLEEILALPA